MKKLQKGFTLVELIVVITILAILGTIAFISLQGYSQDAKNSKVSSDLSTLASAIEISNTKGDTNVVSILDNAKNPDVTAIAGSFGSGITIVEGTNYGVGGVNFSGLQQNGADFKDSQDPARDYVYAYAATGALSYYQIAGEVVLTSGTTETYIKGNYVETITDDVDGLVRGTASAD